jgi:hypothetical protein
MALPPEEFRQTLKDILLVVIGSAAGFLTQHYRRPQAVNDEHGRYQTETIESQGKTLADAFDQIHELRELYRSSERMQKVQWVYILRLLEELNTHGIQAPEPPDELKTDPAILRLVRKFKSDPKIKAAE